MASLACRFPNLHLARHSPLVEAEDATFKEKGRAVMLMPAACMPRAWYSVGMKKPLTITEFARMGGKARAEKLSKEQLSAIGKKGGRPRLDKTTHSTPNS